MKIAWLGHACFVLSSGMYRIVIDPYWVESYPPLHCRTHAVYCSHTHRDHNNADAVELLGACENPFTVEEIPSFHDDKGGALRGSNVIRCFSAEGLRVAHLGDLGHFPDEGQIAAIGACDAILIPVGGVYTIDAALAKRTADALGARVTVPMHYRHGSFGLPELDTADDFLRRFDAQSVTRLETNEFDLTADTPRGVIVPRFTGKTE